MLQKNVRLTLAVLFVASTCVCSTGCVGALAQLLYIIKGHDIPAQYDELEAKSVAVVINTGNSKNISDTLEDNLGRLVSANLSKNVPKIKIVPAVQVQDWVEENGAPEAKLGELGKAVNADFVISIDVENYTIREGSTLYKGRSDISLNVVDSESGQATYISGPDHLEYPENGRPAIQLSDRKFEAFYLNWLSHQITRQFYKYDKTTDFAESAALIR